MECHKLTRHLRSDYHLANSSSALLQLNLFHIGLDYMSTFKLNSYEHKLSFAHNITLHIGNDGGKTMLYFNK